MAEDRITEAVTVPVSAERAFAAFVDDFANWWPREYTWGRGTLESIAIEGHEGGRCVEKGPHGFTCDWGRAFYPDVFEEVVDAFQRRRRGERRDDATRQELGRPALAAVSVPLSSGPRASSRGARLHGPARRVEPSGPSPSLRFEIAAHEVFSTLVAHRE